MGRLSNYNTTVYARGYFYNRGELIHISSYLSEVEEITLPEKETYMIGLDQSSSVCGFYLENLTGDIIVQLDIENLHNSSNRVMMFSLIKRFIVDLVRDRDLKVSHFITEKPFPSKHTKYTLALLNEILGIVKYWISEIPEFWDAVPEAILPPVWRKYANIGKIPAGHKKFHIASVIVKDNPLMETYFENYKRSYGLNGGYDSFEAAGILKGFLNYAYDDYGNEKIHGEAELFHESLVFYKYASMDVEYREDLIPELTMDSDLMKVQSPKFLIYQDRATLYDNIRMASSNYSLIYTIVPDEELEKLKFRYRWDLKPNHCLVMIVTRKKDNINAAYVKYLTDKFPCNDVVQDIKLSKESR